MKTVIVHKMRVEMLLIAVAAILIAGTGRVFADELGRLFTTPAERSMLDELRNAGPEPVKEPAIVEEQIEEIMAPEEKEEAPVLTDMINVRGMVYRRNGRNTAWVNDSNTYAGDLESQYIKIKPEEISRDDVQIIMPDNTTRIKLKVGQSYEPVEEKIIDLIPETGETANTAAQQ
ncbi:MAG: hypothetical protein A2W28_10435 [Gammaproteobacteria bacterium RBG_16_51_14]|nr:MAG: hypothetical protein A2W28_10435 [Gammaproteobacteria bacterium RBG_16_51_14]